MPRSPLPPSPLYQVTHHNPTACTEVAQHGGLRAVMDCFASRDGMPAAAPASSASASTSSVFDVQILALTILANCVEINSDARQALASLAIEEQGGGGGGGVRQQGGRHGGKRRVRDTTIPACAFLVHFLMQHAATFADALAREIGDTGSGSGADGSAKLISVSSITSDSDIGGGRTAFDDTPAGQDAAVAGTDAESGGSFDQDDKEDLILCG